MVVPQLRFKEFDGDWKEDTLKNCITSIDSGWSPQCESYPANSNEWGVLKTTSVDWSGFNSSFNKKLPLELTPRKEIEVKPLDILVTRAGPTERVGVISVVPHSVRSKLMISDKLIRLKANEQNNPLFLGISLSSVKCQNQLQSKTSGLAKSQTNISQKILGEVLLKLPSKEEQTKIASFLSAVDEKISQLTKKNQLLSQYKQGMMQKLFSQQLRFKADDGSEFGEWEERKLGEVCRFVNGRAYKQTEWEKEGTPVIRLQNLTGSGKEYYYSNLNLPDHQYCYNNDLLYMWSATFGPVFWQGEKAIFHYHIWKIEVNPQLLDKKYMYFLLDEMTEKMKRSLNGSTMLHVTKQGMENTEKIIPSLPEQTKIANFLSAIDQKIEVVAQQIEQAKTWKKGLLQQMFV